MCSDVPPRYKDYMWLKPVNTGFVLYYLWNGAWKPLKIVDSSSTNQLTDDAVLDVGSLVSLLGSMVGTDDDTKLSLVGIRDALNETRAAIRTLMTANNLTGDQTASGLKEWDPDKKYFESNDNITNVHDHVTPPLIPSTGIPGTNDDLQHQPTVNP